MLEEKVDEARFHLQSALDLKYVMGIVEGMCAVVDKPNTDYTSKLQRLYQWHQERYSKLMEMPATGKIGFAKNGT